MTAGTRSRTSRLLSAVSRVPIERRSFASTSNPSITMNPALTFLTGLTVLALFAWYFLAHQQRVRRNVATILSILTVTFSLLAIYPPGEAVRLGLDLQGGTSFLVRLLPEGERAITSDSLE